MEKLWIIIKREYLTRVLKKSFIISTFLTPILMVLLFAAVGYFMSYKTDKTQKILVVDSEKILGNTLKDEPNLYFSFSPATFEDAKQNYDANVYNGILYLPAIKDINTNKATAYFYSDERLSLETNALIERKIEAKIRDYKIEKLNLDKSKLESLQTNVTIEPKKINPNGKDEATSLTDKVAGALGTILGIILYMSIILYGTSVMRGVMEEKMNRVVEVIISSVKPTQLMLGKVIGIGAVGLTQLSIWIILMIVLQIVLFPILGIQQTPSATMSGMPSQAEMNPDIVLSVLQELGRLNWYLIIPLFMFYYLTGYLLYASMFAAVGSAVGDDLGESQSLSMPLTIPILLAFYIMFACIRVPHSNLAIVSSIFPLFAPIVMPARLAFSPPAWQIILSIISMIAGTMFFVWLSGKIYRTGILLYGKKGTIGEIWKWLTQK